jgi:hypothetical protein
MGSCNTYQSIAGMFAVTVVTQLRLNPLLCHIADSTKGRTRLAPSHLRLLKYALYAYVVAFVTLFVSLRSG